jgi:hypothetical protein
MNRDQFIRRIRKTGRAVSVDPTRGKGSHARITVDGKTTTIKAGELSRAYVALLLKQLGVPPDALD